MLRSERANDARQKRAGSFLLPLLRYTSNMQPQANTPLAAYTSLAVGGPAEQLYVATTADELHTLLAGLGDRQVWVLGYGANALISDTGLPGAVIVTHGSVTVREGNLLVADAGVWWDDLVQRALTEELWGLEMMSAIPGSVGAAVVGNIAAYGQAVADTLAWVEVFDRSVQEIRRLMAPELGLSYRFSDFQTDKLHSLVILRAAFQLSPEPAQDVVYQSALDIAAELHHDLHTLDGCRQTVLETRARAGSLWDWQHPDTGGHTAGSFFRNPVVDAAAAERLMAFDETGKTTEIIRKMNQAHSGDAQRVSAAHVLLAAGFQRGQTWGPVRLHPDHILKIENTGGATAQQIYDVAQEIIRTVHEKLGITLTPEVRFLGEF